MVRAGNGVEVQLCIHMIEFIEHPLQRLLLSMVPHSWLHLVQGLVAKSRLVRLLDGHSVLVRRQFEGQVFIGVVFPIDDLPLDVLRKVSLIVTLLQAVVRRGLLLAGDEGRLLLRREQDVLDRVEDCDRVRLNHLVHLLVGQLRVGHTSI